MTSERYGATSTRSDSDRTNYISVANMSLGAKGQDDGNCGKTKKDAVHLAICNSVAAGVVYVVSAMNSATDFQDTVPAAYDEVLTATAMTDTDARGVETAADTPEVMFRSDVSVELVRASAQDADVLFAARVSTQGEQSLAQLDADPQRSIPGRGRVSQTFP